MDKKEIEQVARLEARYEQLCITAVAFLTSLLEKVEEENRSVYFSVNMLIENIHTLPMMVNILVVPYQYHLVQGSPKLRRWNKRVFIHNLNQVANYFATKNDEESFSPFFKIFDQFLELENFSLWYFTQYDIKVLKGLVVQVKQLEGLSNGQIATILVSSYPNITFDGFDYYQEQKNDTLDWDVAMDILFEAKWHHLLFETIDLKQVFED